jgi:mono/diheme cytochrome c family protein
MIYQSLISRLLVLSTFVFLTFNFADAQNDLADKGKALFKVNCQSCHNKNMIDAMTGPALGGTLERWEGREELLYEWIRNSSAVIASGDPYAVSLYNEYNKAVMSSFPNLTDADIDALLAYINGVYEGTYGVNNVAGVPGNPQGEVPAEEESNTFLFITLFVILGILAIVLARIISNLNRMVDIREGKDVGRPKSLLQSITNSGVIGFILFALVVFGGYTTVNSAISLGRQQGYQPEQPIKFSHATHAGMQKIECQYCHDGARRSKHSVIPATNTCMNCHTAIKKGSNYGTAELSKIYASVGWDPNTNNYIENYDDMPREDIEKLFKEWITSNYLRDNDLSSLDRAGTREVDRQWDNIVSSLTNDTKTTIKGPIEWVRIHNLPDHVYFNHAQHVSVGKVECQTCHGPVQEMEVVAQHSPLSMGWCINCHRQTEVKFADNPYYESYEKYHEQMKNGDREKVTVEDIGGLECQKCHY